VARTLLEPLDNPGNRRCGCDPDCWFRRTALGRAVKWLPGRLMGPHAGKYALNTILTRKKLVKGATYVIHLTATNANGKKTTLAIRFSA
jgi:hypothetical protein